MQFRGTRWSSPAFALALAITFTLGADVITEHRTEDEVFLGRQLVKRTVDKQTDGIKTLAAAEVNVDILLAGRLHHVGNCLSAQPSGGKSFVAAVAREENHPAHTFLVFIDVVHKDLQFYWKRLSAHLLDFRLLHID